MDNFKKRIATTIFEHSQGVCLNLTIICSAKRTSLEWGAHDQIQVRLKEKPYHFKANEALIKYLSKQLHIPKSQIVIRSGLKSRKKCLLFLDVCLDKLLLNLWNCFQSNR